MIDVTIVPTEAGKPAEVDWRPKSAAFTVRSEMMTVGPGEPAEIDLEISAENKTVGTVKGRIPVGYTPSLPGVPTVPSQNFIHRRNLGDFRPKGAGNH